MTDPLFRRDAYLREAPGVVQSHWVGEVAAGTAADPAPQGVILDQSVFYPNGGGQPGDIGRLTWAGGGMDVLNTIKGEGETIVLITVPGSELPPVGQDVTQHLNWDQRYRHMRMHSALHLLSVVIPLPVTGGQIGAQKGRLDFDMPNPPEDKAAIETALNALIARDLVISEDWITDADLEANPGLVKTMSVSPPRGAGRVRLVRIGQGADQIDLQPCGGTHVARTGEIGVVRLGKIEKKSRQNRRVAIHLD